MRIRPAISPNRRGFSFVELLAVVLILAVVASAAIPAYMNSRATSAARVCKANIAAIAAAQSAYATRFGTYCFDTTTSGGGNGKGNGGVGNGKGKGNSKSDSTTQLAVATAYTPGTSSDTPTGGLLGAPEGLASTPTCPLDGSVYTCTPNSDNPTSVDVRCANANMHRSNMGATDCSAWQWTLTLSGSGSNQ